MISNRLRWLIVLFSSLLLISCGGDEDSSVHEDINKYPNGNTKVHVRFHPETNVLERHISESSGQVISVEFDSLLISTDLKSFLEGSWSVNNQVYGLDTLYNESTLIDSSGNVNDDFSPMEYTFLKDSLYISGSLYHGKCKIKYLDSLVVKIKGYWEFDSPNSDTYRKMPIDRQDTINIQAYSRFIWNNHFSSPKKDNSITFYRSSLNQPKSTQ